MKSFKVEVIADSSGQWASNAVRVATKEEAEAYARNLYSRWTSVRRWQVVESEDPTNFKADDAGNIERLGDLP